MKKNTFTFLLFISLFTVLHAQPSWMILRAAGSVTLPKYKLSKNFVDEFSADYNGEVSYSTTKKIGFQGSIGLGIKNEEETFVLLLTPGFSRKGCKYTTNETTLIDVTDLKGNTTEQAAFVNFDETVDAIHVPILARWQSKGEVFGVSGGIGLSGNYSIGGKNEPTLETEIKTFPGKTQNLKFGAARTDNYRAFDLSMLLHGGVFFKLGDEGRKRLTFSMDYDMGLLNLQTDTRTNFLSAQGIETTGSKKNRALAFSIGLEIWPKF